MPEFVLPGASDRTIVLGGTGTGKTIGGAWLLSKQRFDKRPWVALDFKDEVLWDMVGDPPMRELALGKMPGKSGLYRMRVDPWDEDKLEDWLRDIWRRGNVGLFVDEVGLINRNSEAMKAILRQGRSKLIPVIACTQRPVDICREFYSESQYKMIFRLDDLRDYKTIHMFTGGFDVSAPLPQHCSYWIDTRQRVKWTMKPTPPPNEIASALKQSVPYSWFLG